MELRALSRRLGAGAARATPTGSTIVDKRTVRFHFKEPFLDFPAPDRHRECVRRRLGRAGEILREGRARTGSSQKPIGAGPYKLVSQEPGTKLEFEAFDGYYAPVHIKKFTIVSVPEPATRVAMLERGEADIIYCIPGELVARGSSAIRRLMLAPVVSGNFWLEFPGFQDPKSPFHDKRVREAVSLAIDRDAINQAECAGLGQVDGNWINDDVEYALEWPKWPHDVAKAKKLMAEAGYPNGFNVRLADPGAALLLARRAHRLAAAGDRHPRQAADHGARRLQQAAAGRA